MKNSAYNELKNEIETLSQTIESKTEIFNLLKEKAEPKEHWMLATAVVEHAGRKTGSKYKVFGFVLYILFILLFVAFLIGIESQHKGIDRSFSVLSGFLMLYLYSQAYIKYKLQFYCLVVVIGIMLSLFLGIRVGLGYNSTMAALIFPTIIVTGLAYWLRKMLFRESTFWGRIKKDKSGNYIFSD